MYKCLSLVSQVENVFVPAVGNRDSEDLRQNASSPDPFPPEYYVNFLNIKSIQDKIGANVKYVECSDPVDAQFEKTGDDARTLLPQLSALVNSTLKTLIWVSDQQLFLRVLALMGSSFSVR